VRASPALRRPEAVALLPRLGDAGVEGQPVDDGSNEARITDDAAPLRERQIGSDSDRRLLLALSEDLEQPLRTSGVEPVALGSRL
jgi:hypothetical protein